jgi:hypothetical protein
LENLTMILVLNFPIQCLAALSTIYRSLAASAFRQFC